MTGTEFKTLRQSLGLTQAALAGKLEIAPNSLSRWEMASNQGRWPVPKWAAREVTRMLREQDLDFVP